MPAWFVVWWCALGSFAVPVMSRVGRSIRETLAKMMSQTRISSRYRMHCSSGLRFSCRAWKSCMGSPLPRLALEHGGGGLAALFMWLVCWTGWVACQLINWRDRKSFGELHSTCLIRAMWPDWQCSHVSGVVAFFAIPAMTYSSWGLTESNRHLWGHCLVVARLICGLVMCTGWPCCSCHVSELGGALERLAKMMSQTRISSRYRMHCSSGLRFFCLAWKPYDGSRLPHLARGHGGVDGCTAHVAGLLLGWATCQMVFREGCEIFWWAPQYRK